MKEEGNMKLFYTTKILKAICAISLEISSTYECWRNLPYIIL